ncbi:hypothetical protein CMI37_31465 [Candidatus Pacearchaeota archaeon]|nr:hypothetical protein [Candidatus Pacearchaeota archaeon]|tara:strand:+ start:867 stop:1118 length:252 start_codon:yes stop_codon:yes gene_type:complete
MRVDPDLPSPREDKRDDKQEHKLDKKDAKANLILAKAQKALAAAQKRKWLVILIVVAIGAFYAIKSGGINFGGIIDKVKGWMP